MIAFFILAATVTTTLASCPIKIPNTKTSSYQAFGDDCYYFSEGTQSRFDAEMTCLVGEGRLTSIHSEEENEFIRKHVARTYNSGTKVHIGLEKVLGNFHWLDHSSLDYKNFDVETTNDKAKDSLVVDDMLVCSTLDSQDGKWYEFRCLEGSSVLPYVCKFAGAAANSD